MTFLSEAIQQYYSKAKLSLPASPSRRFWRVKPNFSSFIQIPYRISSTDDLRRWLLTFNPLHAYHSINLFLNAINVGPGSYENNRAGWQKANNLLLEGSLATDIDIFNSLEETLQECFKADDILSEYGDPVTKFTGRGFQSYVPDVDLGEMSEAKPHRRLEQYRINRKPIVKKMEKKKIPIHDQVTLNPKQITRAVSTINSNSGYICTNVSLDNFDLKRVQWVQLSKSRVNMGNHVMREITINTATKDGGSTKPDMASRQSPPPQPAYFVSNRILGTQDRYIFALRLQITKPTKLITRLKYIIKNEKFPSIAIFRFYNRYYAICPVALQRAHYLHLLQRYRFLSTKITMYRFKQLLLFPYQFCFSIKSPYDGEPQLVSHAHYKWLTRKAPNYKLSKPILCGSPELKIGIVQFLKNENESIRRNQFE